MNRGYSYLISAALHGALFFGVTAGVFSGAQFAMGAAGQGAGGVDVELVPFAEPEDAPVEAPEAVVPPREEPVVTVPEKRIDKPRVVKKRVQVAKAPAKVSQAQPATDSASAPQSGGAGVVGGGAQSGTRGGTASGGGAGGTSAAPDYLHNPAPVYPTSARRNREEGVVTLRVLVSPSGEPVTVRLKTSSGVSALDESALETVRRWRFKPGVLLGAPVQSEVDVPIRFHLKG